MLTDRCGNTRRQKCCTKGSGIQAKTQEFMHRDTTNVEPEMYDYSQHKHQGLDPLIRSVSRVQLLAPPLLRSSNCSPSFWSVVV